MTTHHPQTFTRRSLILAGAALPAVSGAARLPEASAHKVEVPAQARALATPDIVAEQIVGNTVFAFDLFGALRQSVSGNLLVSPYSISQALAMTYAGARGETAVQMEDVLNIDPTAPEALSLLNADLIARGNAQPGSEPDVGRSLRIANALWIEQTYPVEPSYVDEIELYYEAGLHQADFRNAPEEVREEINSWVEAQTEDRIQDIVAPSAITADTVLALVNAIYFYGAWQHAFAPEDTRDEVFHRLDGTVVKVPMMYQVAEMPYLAGTDYQMVELPYAQSGLTLTVILPDEGQFEVVESRLNAQIFNAELGRLDFEAVDVYLPRFELEFGTIELNETLKALGMTDAFSKRADFTGISKSGLVLTKVLHKTFIGVDEKGTEATAATVVLGGTPPAKPPLVVRIDRPFLFAIRDTQTGTLLFLGRVKDPSW